jgi:hypothetical protein
MAGPAVSFTFVRRRSSLPHIVRHDQFLVPGYAFMLGASPRLICSRVTPGLPYSLGGGPELLARWSLPECTKTGRADCSGHQRVGSQPPRWRDPARDRQHQRFPRRM